MMREMNMMDIPSDSHLQGINVVTYCSVVPMHAEMVVRKDIGWSVDIMQGQPHCGHHSLTWRSSHHHHIIIIIIIITDLCSSRRIQEMWERSQQCRCHVGGGDVWNKKILTGIFQLVSPVGVNLVTKVGPVGPPVVLGLRVPPGLGGDGCHQDHQSDDISDGADHPESLRSLDTGHWTHSCLVAWRGEQLQNVSKLFRVQS